MADASGFGLGQAVALLGAATIAVPLFRRLGLGSVLGYLAAGLAVGPFGFGLIANPETLLRTAELGVSPVDTNAQPVWQAIAIAVAGLAALLAAGRWLLDPFFRISGISWRRLSTRFVASC